MLEKVNLKHQLSKNEYKSILPSLQRRLYDLEKACWDHKVASILVFEGWDASGKGSAISTLTARLDPRGFKLHPITPPRTYEQNRPWLWRFWLRTPNYGEMAIFDRSWYRRVLEDKVEKRIPKKEAGRAFRDIVEFEQMLADDGTVIVKFWLHISKKEQKKRFCALEKDPLESWRVAKEDWARHQKYNVYLKAAEEMLARTESEYGPWTIVDATSRWYARRNIFETVIRTLEARLGKAAPPVRPPAGKERAPSESGGGSKSEKPRKRKS
jgi:polyphosphate kinase 2 (PPK2 family)